MYISLLRASYAPVTLRLHALYAPLLGRLHPWLAPITRLTPYDIDPALDRLADVLEERLGLATVRRLLGL